ncbi:MAG: redoxin domain-containing protein [Legionellales bacterium]|nr:redoxin domain-containing protein [Legionellales bacterium]
MYRYALMLVLGFSLLAGCGKGTRSSEAQLNQPAPLFSAATTQNDTIHLNDFLGNSVVLEWADLSCPYVTKFYQSRTMQMLQKKYESLNVAWITILSTKPGTEGHMTAQQANDYFFKMSAIPTAVILDESGELAKLYGITTTPEIRIIDHSGTLVYQGAIDSIASTDVTDIQRAENYVDSAFNQILAGQLVLLPETEPYGCPLNE